MLLAGIIEKQEVVVYIDDETGKAVFRSEVLPNKEYNTPGQIGEALKRWDLDQRKKLGNPEAFMLSRSYGRQPSIISVTVTSISPDGTEAWIKDDVGARRKLSVESLYANREEVEGALRVEAERKKAVDDAWAGVTRWKPEQAKEGAADGN